MSLGGKVFDDRDGFRRVVRGVQPAVPAAVGVGEGTVWIQDGRVSSAFGLSATEVDTASVA